MIPDRNLDPHKRKEAHTSGIYLGKYKRHFWDFPGGPLAKTLCCPMQGPGSNPWSGSYIPCATAESPYAVTKDPASCN